MLNRQIFSKLFVFLLTVAPLAACSDDDNKGATDNSETYTFTDSEWFPGGELGTTSNEVGCYANASPAVEQQGLETAFNNGEMFFERDYTLNTQPFRGLGPAYVRPSCIYCHPNYGHGKRQTQYRANQMGNGYLLAIYYPKGSGNPNGGTYSEDTYVSEVVGVPQTAATTPFLPPLDESGISIQWLKAQDEHGNTFPDGETYDLIYPEVTIDRDAFNTDPKPHEGYVARVESTIGIQGTALLDAIPEDSIKKQYADEAPFATLNPMMWDYGTNSWASTAWATLKDGSKAIKKFNYQLSRGSLQDDYAIWEICNVTRGDIHYLYTTKAWAKAMSQNEDVLSYIMKHGSDENSLLRPYYGNGSRDSVSYLVNLLLGLDGSDNNGTGMTDAAIYERYFVNKFGEEMKDENYYEYMVWQRGLAVPKARDLDDPIVQRGKAVFMQIGCANCHRPSWTTGADNYWATSFVKGQGAMPVYAHQKIWPYSDMVQHRLFMKNDIINDWCRTAPLWGRGLSFQETGAEDRLHDCRARNEIEAIMWHGYSPNSDAYSATQSFYKLSKSDRDAVVKFLRAI